MRKSVFSFFDYTGVMVEPWAKEGYQCYIFDLQHTVNENLTINEKGGFIKRINWDSDLLFDSDFFFQFHQKPSIVFGFPPCTDLAVSGARHFEAKFNQDPFFQRRAYLRCKIPEKVSDLFGCPWMVENPVSVLSTLWRKPNYSFHPYEYGGYISPQEGKHPYWGDFIADFDAYTKKTCIWSSHDFIMPHTKPVDIDLVNGGEKTSVQFRKLGGKSLKTKNIRSATPRGFAKAVFESNHESSFTL